MSRLDVVLCWHMHQPDYRHHGEYLRPWTWLHAIKDYSDMAAHLERVPAARAVINFSPVLIEQLQDYAARLEDLLEHAVPVRDALLDALAGRLPAAVAPLLRSLLRVNEARMKSRFEPYARLHGRVQQVLAEDGVLARQELDDLLVWYVLVWLGESLRDLPLVIELQGKGSRFTAHDRHRLLALVQQTIGGLVPRYRALAESGQVELSVTPYAHPMLPLLLDLRCAREALPGLALPDAVYEGGAERCDWHLAKAKQIFHAAFGFPPQGCWPSEGGISTETLRLLSRHDFRWTASGARVLLNSLGSDSGWPQLDGWRLAGEEGRTTVCFFRDDALSDRIGFEYSKWPAAEAIADFIQRLEQILSASGGAGKPALCIIMDGENAWEYFPRNGWDFLSGLYARLSTHPRIRLCTFTETLSGITPRELPRVVAGSWVHGTFSTWVGDAAKNRAWELLAAARRAVDATLATQAEHEAPGWMDTVLRQLAVCEASDWFWWLGTDNQLQDGPDFDRLFRQQLADLYELIGSTPPPELQVPINGAASEAPGVTGQAAGAMRPAGS